MDTAEIVVYLLIATIVGGLIILMISRYDASGTYDKVKGLFGEKETGFEKTDENSTAEYIFKAWQSCGLGTIDKRYTFQYTGTGEYDKTMFFTKIKELRLCATIQSSSNACGAKEDMTMGFLEPGKIYSIQCDNTTRTMRIE